MRHGWSLNRKDWADLDKAVRDLDWKSVEFRADRATDVPTSCGVYAICTSGTKATSGLLGAFYNVLYVGESGDLRTRFRQHSGENPQPKIRSARSCFVHAQLKFWYACTSSSGRFALERTLIAALGPPANQNSGSGIKIGASLGAPIDL